MGSSEGRVAKKKKQAEEIPDTDEVITGETTNTGDTDRKIRVYGAHEDDDMILTLPPGCRLTFGYFNPGPPASDDPYRRGRSDHERKTALRVYQGTGNGNQLAAFLGVRGFRDESIHLAKIVKKVTVESRLVDDEETGTQEYSGSRKRELKAIAENTEF